LIQHRNQHMNHSALPPRSPYSMVAKGKCCYSGRCNLK